MSEKHTPVAWMWQTKGGTKLAMVEPADYEEVFHLVPLFGPDLAAEVERLRGELAAERRKVEALREMVQESADTFRRYETLHRAKGTDVDSLRKAAVNAEIAASCEAALAATEQKGGA